MDSSTYTQNTLQGMESASFSPKIIAVGGGKGGIGKSLVSSGLAISLANMGYKTLAVDLDFGGANLHTWLGEKHLEDNLSSFLNHSSSLDDLVKPAKRENLSLLLGAREHLAATNLKHLQKTRLFKHLTSLPFDWIIVELGAGSGYNVLDFFIAADRSILVCIPEPTSIENAYHFVRAAFFRKLAQANKNVSFQKYVKSRAIGEQGLSAQVPRKILEDIDREFPELAPSIRSFVQELTPLLLVNQVISEEDSILEAKIRIGIERFLGIPMRTIGMIRHDEAVLRSIRKYKNPVEFQPDCFAATDITQIARRVIRGPNESSFTQSSLF